MFEKISGSEVKLVDFGLSVQSNKRLHVQCGTPYFMSPEVIRGNYGQKADIWAVGCVMYMMVCGKLPFAGKTRDEVH